MQSKKKSFLEAFLNMAIGFIIAVLAQVIIFPWFDIHIPLQDDLLIGGCFTIVSLARSYLLRRFFNWLDYGNKNTSAGLGNNSPK